MATRNWPRFSRLLLPGEGGYESLRSAWRIPHLLEFRVGDAGRHADLEDLARLQDAQALQLVHDISGRIRFETQHDVKEEEEDRGVAVPERKRVII